MNHLDTEKNHEIIKAIPHPTCRFKSMMIFQRSYQALVVFGIAVAVVVVI